jgi:hypothetical protein
MAIRERRTTRPGVSLAKGPVGIIGMILLAYGVTGLIFGGNTFDSAPLDGTVNGDTWLGIEGNGWSNLLAIGAGGILLFGAQLHWSAKTTALIVGLGFAAAAIIALVDGNDVLGIFAANDATKLAWAIVAAALVIVAFLPRVGRKKGETTDTADTPDADRTTAATTTTAPETTSTTTTEPTRDARFDRDRETGGAVAERRVEQRP